MTTPDQHPETLAWKFAALAGDYALYFNASDVHAPDAMPWTFEFKHEGEDIYFAGTQLDELFTWAIGFVEGKLDRNGREIAA